MSRDFPIIISEISIIQEELFNKTEPTGRISGLFFVPDC